jgi:pimeloyl-ACP methyl ester carboxylesterase
MKKKSKRIYALHGMAGSPNDWNILEAELKGTEYKIIKGNSYNPSVLSQIEDESVNVIVVTHSWGAYVLIKNMRKFKITDKIEKVILVNPYVEVENQLKPIIVFLLQLPFLGNHLIKLSHKRGAIQFLQKMIYPYRYTDVPYFREIEEHLQNLNEWKKIIKAKIQHQVEALDSRFTINTPTDVMIGNKDKASSNGIQMKLINKIFKNVKIHEFTSEGHSLLWTQAQKIKEILDFENQKIRDQQKHSNSSETDQYLSINI